MVTDTERILKIIQAVRKQECLWNARSPEYAKRDKLERAWLAVSQEVGKDDVFCREKWRNVRTGFLRSMQNNISVVADESSNDFRAMRRKRFYLYDYMKFLLPSAEVLEKVRKRRRLAHVLSDDDEDSRINNEYSDTTMQDYTTTVVGKCEVRSDNENTWEKENPHVGPEQGERGENDTHYQQILKELENPKKNEACSSERSRDYDEREAEQMLNFFKGNIGDILILSKKNQRLFKRKMLDIIEQLHSLEEISEN